MSLNYMKQTGTFSWNELMTQDIQASKFFYNQLFNWDFTEINIDNESYSLIKIGDKEIGGMMKNPSEAMLSAWGAYVTVDNVDTTVIQAEQLGAKIWVSPKDIPNIGRFAVIQDPQGALLSLITYKEGL